MTEASQIFHPVVGTKEKIKNQKKKNVVMIITDKNNITKICWSLVVRESGDRWEK